MKHVPLMAGTKVFRVGEWWGLVSKFVTKPWYALYYVHLNIQYFIPYLCFIYTNARFTVKTPKLMN